MKNSHTCYIYLFLYIIYIYIYTCAIYQFRIYIATKYITFDVLLVAVCKAAVSFYCSVESTKYVSTIQNLLLRTGQHSLN